MFRHALTTSLLAAMALSTSATAQWGFVTGNYPPERDEAQMCYDLFRGQVVLYGGTNGVGGNDTWTYDGTAWTQHMPTADPGSRRRAQLVHNILNGRSILYGGSDGNRLANDQTWEWNGTDWAAITTSGSPGGRTRYGATFDAARNRMVLFGGVMDTWNGQPSTDTWEYDGSSWNLVTTFNNPGGRINHSMCYHIAQSKVFMFGGEDVAGAVTDTTWEYDGVNWTAVPVTGPRPQGRLSPGFVYDATRGLCVLFGGFDPVSWTILNDTWEFDGTTWTQIQGPTGGIYPPRYQFNMAMDLALGRIVLFGGRTANNAFRHDTWEYGASFRTYGSGCLGSNGIPQLTSTRRPQPGMPMSLNVSNLNTTAPVAFIVTGISNQISSFGRLPVVLTPLGLTNCRAWVSDDLFDVLGASNGSATWNWTVPNLATLVGTTYYQQAVCPDPGINPAGLTLSNAAASLIGH